MEHGDPITLHHHEIVRDRLAGVLALVAPMTG
jgi:hypothetical protein